MDESSRLADLRAAIDDIDDRLVDLLVERLRTVARIAALKGDRDENRLALRPAREAAILRRLIARADGRFPRDSLVRMWRELFAAATRLQTPFTLALCREQEELAIVARDHFGAVTPVVDASSPAHALRLLDEGRAQLALLPLPGAEDRWWIDMATAEPFRPRVVARLPFVRLAGIAAETGGLLVGDLPLQASGEDRSLLVLEAREDLSRSRLRTSLKAPGLDPIWLAVAYQRERGSTVHLIEVAGFHDRHSGTLHGALAGSLERLTGLSVIGAYPSPMENSRGD